MDNPKRKVALFSTNFLAATQTFIYNEIRSLKTTEINVFSKKRMNEERFPFDKVFALRPSKTLKDFIESIIYEYFCYSKKFIKLFEQNKYDLVHAQFGPAGIYAMFFSKRFHLPLMVTFCGYDVGLLQTARGFLPQYWRYRFLSKILTRRCTLILAVSQELANRLISVGVPADKIRVFHRGVDIPECKTYHERTPDEPVKVIMAGRYVEKKGFEYGIEAVALARQAGANIELEIVGKGELKEKCVRLIHQLGIQDHVKLVDELKQSVLFEHYCANDVVMVPSVQARNGDVEGLPNVIKEGAARGLVALVSTHSGCPDAVDDGVSGYVVPERDSRALADKLIEIAKHPECIEQMGRKGYEKMCREFDINITGQHLEELYDLAIQMHKDKA